MTKEFSPTNFFNLDSFEHRSIFDGLTNVWEALAKREEYVNGLFKRLESRGEISTGAYFIEGGELIAGAGSIVEPGVRIKGKVIIGADTKIMSGTFLIGSTIIGSGCTINGEVDNSIILDNIKSNHRGNYIGHSIIGNEVGIAANTVLSNRKVNRTEIMIKDGQKKIPTGYYFFSSVIGDRSRTGCNISLGPGALVGQDCWVLSSVGSIIIPSKHLVKSRTKLEFKPRQDL